MLLLLVCSGLPSINLLAAEPAADTWLQWRGPQRDSQIAATLWPTRLDEASLKSTWRVPLGPSYSGPIVTADRVFVTETKDKKFEVVKALRRDNGELIWETQWEGAMAVPFFAAANGSWIRATPVYDGERLYVAGMRDVLVCLDAKNGDKLWTIDFVKQVETPLPSFGFASSPMIDGDHLYVQAGASLAKIDKRTGEIVWRALQDSGGMMGSAFSSPVMATLHGQRQVVVQTRKSLAGIDAESGEVLWSQDIPAFRGMNILTPTIVDNGIFTSSYGGTSLLFAIKAKDSEGAFAAQETWKNRTQGYMSSPVVIDGFVYLHLRNRRFTCIDLASGETKWTTKPFGEYWSMVASGNRILALDERGELLLIAANHEKFELIDRRQISEDPTWAHLAVCGDELFVRELGAISAFRWTASKEEADSAADASGE